MSKPRQVTGFTLVEVVATIVILGIALAGVAGMVNLGASNSANTLVQTRAVALAQSYLDEILGRRFDERSGPDGFNPCFGFSGADPCTDAIDLGPDGGGESGRDHYDDVDDYDGMTEGFGEAAAIADAEGNSREEYANFHVQVTVRYAGNDDVLSLSETNAKLITVIITTRDQQDGWKFSVYKANY